MMFMTDHSKTTTEHGNSFVQARQRALTRLHSGMELRWSPARSRDDLHPRLRRRFRRSSWVSTASRSPTRPERSMEDERE